jgi:uncharacterized membrane protein
VTTNDPEADAGDGATSTVIEPTRLASFSDGVIAVIITIMVLQFAVPQGGRLTDLVPLIPTFLSYALSFVFVGIYWNNHHHLIRATERIDPRVMWTNLHLLFWLALIPFATAWLGAPGHYLMTWPVFLYGLLCLVIGVSYRFLQQAIARANPGLAFSDRIRRDYKGLGSVAIYAVGCGLAFVAPLVSIALYAAVAIIWSIPDRRLIQGQ